MDSTLRYNKKTIDIGYLLIFIYSLLLLAEYAFTNFIAKASDNGILAHAAVFGFLIIVLSPPFYRSFRSYEIHRYTEEPERSRKLFVFGITFLITFAVFFISYKLFPDRTVGTDVSAQLEQVYSGKYNDWHPVIQTLLVMTLPIKLTGTEVSVYVLQHIAFAAALGWLCETMFSVSRSIYSLIIPYILIIFNPYTIRLITYPAKDVSFSVTGMLLFTSCIKIYYSRGEWFHKKQNAVLFIITFILTTLFRHNGILFTLPLLLVILPDVKRRKWITAAVIALLGILLIRYPLYAAIGVESPGSRVSETTGVCMNIIGNTMREVPELVSDETRQFAYSVASPEAWAENPIGNFNITKFGSANTNAIDMAGFAVIFKATADCLIHAPKHALAGFFRLTDFLYGFNMVYGGRTGLILLAYGLGATNYIALYTIFAKTDFKKKEDRLRFYYCLPPIIYSLGTMLLLTGNTDSKLFFIDYVTIPLFYLIMFVPRDDIGKEPSKPIKHFPFLYKKKEH